MLDRRRHLTANCTCEAAQWGIVFIWKGLYKPTESVSRCLNHHSNVVEGSKVVVLILWMSVSTDGSITEPITSVCKRMWDFIYICQSQIYYRSCNKLIYKISLCNEKNRSHEHESLNRHLSWQDKKIQLFLFTMSKYLHQYSMYRHWMWFRCFSLITLVKLGMYPWVIFKGLKTLFVSKK